MFRNFRFLTVLTVLAILMTCSSQMRANAQSGTAFLRAVHFLTGGPKIDIFVDGNVVLTNLGFQDATAYVQFTEGTHQIDYNVAGKGTPSGTPITLQARAGDTFTFVFSGNLENKALDVYMTSETGLAKGSNLTLDNTTMPLLFVQGSKGVDAVDVYLDDNLVGSVTSGNSLVALAPLSAFKMKITPAGDATQTLVESTNVGFGSTLGVIGLTGPAEKLSLDAAYSTFFSAEQFFEAQKDSKGVTFNTLTKAVAAANLTDTLSNPGTLTIFAPDDTAFAKIDAADLDEALADPAAIGDVLNYHMFNEPLVFDDILNLILAAGTKKTLQGADMSFEIKDNQMTFGGTGATLAAWNIHTSNAVIHVIDTVLVPA